MYSRKFSAVDPGTPTENSSMAGSEAPVADSERGHRLIQDPMDLFMVS